MYATTVPLERSLVAAPRVALARASPSLGSAMCSQSGLERTEGAPGVSMAWGTVAVGGLLTAVPLLIVTLGAVLLALVAPAVSERRARQADQALGRLVSLARVLRSKGPRR